MFQKDYFQQLLTELTSYPQGPQLVAVSKYAPIADIEAAVAAGQQDFGESRAQDLQAKAAHFAALSEPIRWHFIGHLQRNKLAKVAPLIRSLHSLDSLALAQALATYYADHPPAQPIDVYIQINLSAQAQKYGFASSDQVGIHACSAVLKETPQLRWAGLMGMSSEGASPDQIRREFTQLKNLRDQLQCEYPHKLGLSMGMSHDFKLALALGATVLRIGSSLFLNDQ